MADTSLIAHLVIRSDKTALAERRAIKRLFVGGASSLGRRVQKRVRTYVAADLLALDAATELMAATEQLCLDRIFSVSSSHVLALTATSRCSAYDCEYVALAQSHGIEMVSFDGRPIKQFPGTVVAPEVFVEGSGFG